MYLFNVFINDSIIKSESYNEAKNIKTEKN